MNIEMTEVKSSAIKKIGYDQKSKTLRVQWKNGGIYDYEGVPFHIYVDVKYAKSIGKEMNDIVKTYKSIKVKGEE